MNAASSHRSPVKRGMGLLASFLLGVAVTTLAHRMPWDAREVIADAEASPAPPRAAEPSPQQSAQPSHEAAAVEGSPSAAVEREAPEKKPAAASGREPAASEPAPSEPSAARPSTPQRGKARKAAARRPEPRRAREPEAQAEPERRQPAEQHTRRDKASSAMAQEPIAAERPANENEMDRLLERALDGASGEGSGSGVPTEELPAVPSKQDIAKAVSVLFPAIQGCAQGKSGMAVVDLVVRNDGRVVSAKVSGHPFEGTAAGRCIAGVIRRARFPRFAKPSFRVRYPLSIRP